MVVNQSYTLAVGEEIQKVTDDVRVKIIQNSEDSKATYVFNLW